MELHARTREILNDLIAFPSVSSESNQALITYAAGLLDDCGAKIDFTTSPCGRKANLFATLGPEVDGGILLSGHSDVVPVTDQDWSSDPFNMEERDGRLYGRGSCDMKGFIAATLAMAPIYATQVNARPIHFAFTYDEEVGCLGAQHLAEDLTARGILPGVAIIGEPTEMRVIEGHKGCYEYSTHFHGLPGHGSAPDLGVNAVEYAVRYVSELLQLKQRLRGMAPVVSHFDPPWTTVNVGAMQGGVAHNVIAPKAQVDWEMRPVCARDADLVKTELRRLCEEELLPEMRQIYPEADITVETIGEVAGLEPMAENEARRIMSELTGANGADLVAFGTEAGIFQALGMDVVVCGPGSINQAHKADEYLSLDQLDQCLSVLKRLGGYL
ncbi:acetylornithine deacetylase [Pseudophaeobacter flagellatus]|uniref:acetylornithine deacetylase n=1 Tax=Pseudophaeobacter flagellatus TaxID=2899119 RepID=UPI001E5A02CF|nr:acetylornithine deacetylase [Pseudophaeobacter flagellatus]MCD9148832.1 acetylornithine deacetylase [Pseudophaeobacter flagellatus]